MDEQAQVVEIGEHGVEDLAARVEGGGRIILPRDGRPVAAVIGVETLRVLTDERELLRRLALGELESAAGEGDDLEAVLDDCRLLLEEN